MSFITDMQALAANFAVSDFFTDAVITRSTASFDPVSGATTESKTSIPCRAVMSKQTITNSNGALVKATVITCDHELEIDDIVTLGSSSFTISSVDSVAPHGDAFLWIGAVK